MKSDKTAVSVYIAEYFPTKSKAKIYITVERQNF
jgi:hypothetical protein